MFNPALKGRAKSLPEFDAYPTYNFLDMNFGYGKGVKLLDKSPFHSHGDITTATWTAGLHHRCLDFNSATPDYVEIPASHTQLNFTSEDFSLIMRIRFDSIAAGGRIFNRGLDDTDGWHFQTHANGGLFVYTNQAGASQWTFSGNNTIAIATDFTIGFSRDGATITPHINGVATVNIAGTHINPLPSARSAKIGIHNNKTTTPFDGKIEFFRVFGGIALPAEAHLWFHNMLK